MKPVWLISSALFFARSILYKRDIKMIREKFRSLDLNKSNRIYPVMPLFIRFHPYCLRMYKDTDLGGGVRIKTVLPMNTATRQLSASLDIWYLEENDKIDKDTKDINRDSLKASLLDSKKNKWNKNDNVHSNDNKSDSNKKKPLFFFIHGGGWKGGKYINMYMHI